MTDRPTPPIPRRREKFATARISGPARASLDPTQKVKEQRE